LLLFPFLVRRERGWGGRASAAAVGRGRIGAAASGPAAGAGAGAEERGRHTGREAVATGPPPRRRSVEGCMRRGGRDKPRVWAPSVGKGRRRRWGRVGASGSGVGTVGWGGVGAAAAAEEEEGSGGVKRER
jgi:hypothetical protein